MLSRMRHIQSSRPLYLALLNLTGHRPLVEKRGWNQSLLCWPTRISSHQLHRIPTKHCGRCRLDRTDVTALYLDPRGMVHCLQRAPNAKNFSCRWWPEEIESRKDGLGLILYNGCSQQFAAREQVGLEWLCFYWSWSKRVRLQVESFHIWNIKHKLIIKLIIELICKLRKEFIKTN